MLIYGANEKRLRRTSLRGRRWKEKGKEEFGRARGRVPLPHPFERLPRRPKAHRTGSGHQKLKERIQDFDWIPGEGFTSDTKLVSWVEYQEGRCVGTPRKPPESTPLWFDSMLEGTIIHNVFAVQVYLHWLCIMYSSANINWSKKDNKIHLSILPQSLAQNVAAINFVNGYFTFPGKNSKLYHLLSLACM